MKADLPLSPVLVEKHVPCYLPAIGVWDAGERDDLVNVRKLRHGARDKSTVPSNAVREPGDDLAVEHHNALPFAPVCRRLVPQTDCVRCGPGAGRRWRLFRGFLTHLVVLLRGQGYAISLAEPGGHVLWTSHLWGLLAGQEAQESVVLLRTKSRLTIGKAKRAISFCRSHDGGKVRNMEKRAVTPGQARVIWRVHPLDVGVPDRMTLARAEEHWYWAL